MVLCIVSRAIACSKKYLLLRKMWVGVILSKREMFSKKCMMKGYHPHHHPSGMIRDSLVWEGLRCWLSRVRCEHEGLYPRLRTGLSSFITSTHDKYNQSRLYGQSLNLNSHGPNPRIMTAGEHREDKEGECFVLVWAWWWPCSFRYNH